MFKTTVDGVDMVIPPCEMCARCFHTRLRMYTNKGAAKVTFKSSCEPHHKIEARLTDNPCGNYIHLIL